MKKIFVINIFLALGAVAFAQQTPHLGYVYPAGGRPGTTFTAVIGGQYLSGVTNFSVVMDGGYGVGQKVDSYDRPLRPAEQQAMKEELSKFQEKRKSGGRLTVADLARLDVIKRLLAQFGRRPPNPAISEFMTVQLTLATNAGPGDHEIRVRTTGGLSNPLKFCVGLLPETTKPDWKAVPKDRANANPALPRPVEATVRLPATINGQIAPAGVDRYHFWARQGQQLIIAVEARRLIPYLADAVPGWFEPTLKILDSKGKEVASAERYQFRPDPVLHLKVPRDGTYTLEIHDSLYRGREDFIYRLTIGELPFVTSIFPLGEPAGTVTTVALRGWNLSATNLTQEVTFTGPGVYQLSTTNGEHVSNLVPFAVDALPEIFENEPHAAAAVRRVTLPVIVNGQIEKPGEAAVFSFAGRAGDEIVAEVMARRLDSPLDSTLQLTDANGRQIAFNDDFEDKGSGLETHHADSYLRVTLPTNGVYFLHLRDAQRQGGPEFSYRLRISAPQPDFALRIVPSSVAVRGGGTVPLTVFALRRDGFTNEIRLHLNDAPDGFALAGARIPTNQDQVRFTLTARTVRRNEPLKLEIEGRAMVGGQEIVRPGVPAEDMMQAFAYRHLVPSKQLLVAVGGFWTQRVSLRIAGGATPVIIPAGGAARVLLAAPGNAFTERFKLELNEPPEGVSLRKVSPTADGVELEFAADAKAKSGLAGNLIVSILAERSTKAEKGKKQTNTGRLPMGVLPAIPFLVVAAVLEHTNNSHQPD